MRPLIPLMLAAAFHLGANATPTVVHTQAQLNEALASGQPTPLDALTPYGKRRFIRGLRWGERSVGGFSPEPLERELTSEQLRAALHFIDSDSLLPMLGGHLTGPPLRLPEPSAEAERRLEQLESFAEDDVERRRDAGAAVTTLDGEAVLRRYQELFGDRLDTAALRRQPLGDLLPLFDAAQLAAGKSPDSAAFGQLLLVHAELSARGIDTRRTLDDRLLYAMLAARRFEQARTFAAARPHLAHRTVPRIVDELGPGFGGRSEFRYDAGNKTLTRVAAPAAEGTELLMVVGSGCHFSQNALDAIAADPALLAQLREARLTVITPPHAPIPLDYVTRWNAAHPALPIRIPAHAREWPAVDVLGTPAFYLLKDGKVVTRRSGWPEGGNKAGLKELLDAAGR